MKKRLFQYAVLFHERTTNKDLQKEEFNTQVIVPIGIMLATDEKIAALKIAREIDEKYVEQLQDIEILIRPFA